jgi:catechol 2,3-dioxygenase-like lactoylglutathione lyase family enzyme
MLVAVHPKLPMRDKARTLDYYTRILGFKVFGSPDYPDYLMLEKDAVQLHFFAYPDLNPAENYGQVYIRCSAIDHFYASLLEKGAPIHPAGPLAMKPWGQREFSMLDPDNNLLTFGQSLD